MCFKKLDPTKIQQKTTKERGVLFKLHDALKQLGVPSKRTRAEAENITYQGGVALQLVERGDFWCDKQGLHILELRYVSDAEVEAKNTGPENDPVAAAIQNLERKRDALLDKAATLDAAITELKSVTGE